MGTQNFLEHFWNTLLGTFQKRFIRSQRIQIREFEIANMAESTKLKRVYNMGIILETILFGKVFDGIC